MAEALLISETDVRLHTVVSGNLDVDKFIQFIKIAQDLHLVQIIGSKLIQKIQDDILNDDLSGNYLTLTTDYIKPVLIHYAMVEYLPFAAFTLANGGVYKHTSENSESVQKNEVDFLVEKERSIAENYRQRLIDFINKDTTLFPEYHSNSSGDVFPSHNNWFGGWEI